ncbi:MAG: EF-P lysine aminoacylase GenX [Candidatus Thiodiazotropha sp. (ex Ctena orbiculata)]|uniref:EF-P lysine aminoacylase GenX n=1 Tax=Candidatus Thiodiazotropha taylori TaxID=2792791 RepID=A0A944M6H3_9GAMM|nr:EF-P lysine aminoacylase GenX [Candidatus Thiodiazotropha taylori]MBT3026329.1 EF-P lysine aminoacylase GenX [Candidatus Thiodiazotropha taylori]MBT3035740.1 EF-P lysine aminoacylase GenX [Candidatus Thiodiazotropha taylori]MBV2138807.1 EF-P lysine aminoacylase GenX [Candidatus Thiodiazotropha taylori]PUB88987.1 MAG: EF-P lysine aminoacylase GenX [gamma proteobacterium symbiont of Ctena orbiculata]
MTATDEWQPSATVETIRARAEMLARIRQFFNRIGVLEVETPICSRYATTDPALESFSVRYTGPGAARGRDLYLHTSPEFAMKRLLAAGSGPIYQICKVFRNGEYGSRHNPEFSLLEWYRPGLDYHQLMDEVAQLINGLSGHPHTLEKVSYAALLAQHLDLDPHSADTARLRQCAITRGIPGAERLALENRDGWLDLLMSHLIEPRLGQGGMTFVYDYPASQAALARIRKEPTPVAERFELYMEGIEIANGFQELTSAEEQRRRFKDDSHRRRESHQTAVPMDQNLLAALAAGLPDCSGVALGLDRLLLVLTGVADIRRVVTFDLNRA